MFDRKVGLYLADAFFVFQQGDQFDSSFAHALKIKQVLCLIHLKERAHDIMVSPLFGFGLAPQFTIQS